MGELMAHKLALLGGRPVRTLPFSAWPIFGKTEEKRLLRALRSGKWGRAVTLKADTAGTLTAPAFSEGGKQAARDIAAKIVRAP